MVRLRGLDTLYIYCVVGIPAAERLSLGGLGRTMKGSDPGSKGEETPDGPGYRNRQGSV